MNSNVVRSVRLGGNWNNGANYGFSYVNANNAPSNANANYGGDLFISYPVDSGSNNTEPLYLYNTLTISSLREIGVSSSLVLIRTEIILTGIAW